MKVYHIRLRELKKRQYSSFYLRKKDFFDFRPPPKNHNWVLLFSYKISKIEVNQPNILIFSSRNYIYIRCIKRNYALIKFHFNLKCNEFCNRLNGKRKFLMRYLSSKKAHADFVPIKQPQNKGFL